ncbi:hypothetical protein GCM10027425_18750 [Alteromonas gracilis]
MLTALIALVPLAVDPVPEDNDVVAGPWGAAIIGFMIIATALLLWAFTRQLRRAQRLELPTKAEEEAERREARRQKRSQES